MNLRIADRWRLFIYNYFKGPYDNWLFQHRYRAEWVAEGRDPDRMPKFGKISLDDLDWGYALRDKMRLS